MFDVGERFRTDKAKETEGTWVDLGGGSRIKVARDGNRNYARMLTSEYEKNQTALEGGSEDADSLSDTLMSEVMAKTILVDWESIAIDGKAMPYSVEAAAKMLIEFPDFRRMVSKQAGNFDNFKSAKEKTQEKNSEKPSSSS